MMGVFLFYANKGYHPYLQTHSLQDLPSESTQQFAANLEIDHLELKEAILDV